MARFQRKHPDASGVYRACLREKADGTLEELKITGREIFETDAKATIEFLRNDPEIIEVNKKTQIESEEE